MDKLTIGFNYEDLAVANLCQIILGEAGMGETIQIQEAMNIAERLGISTTVENITAANDFARRRPVTYTLFSPIHQQVESILANPDYFPENKDDFIAIIKAHEERDLTPSEYAMVEAHGELLEFWKKFALHVSAQDTITGMVEAYGIMNVAVFDDNDWPCLYHRGMTNLEPSIQVVVDAYNQYKAFLGFTPAMLPGSELVLPTLTKLLIDVATTDVKVSGLSLAGRFWFEGKPTDNLPGSAHLQVH